MSSSPPINPLLNQNAIRSRPGACDRTLRACPFTTTNTLPFWIALAGMTTDRLPVPELSRFSFVEKVNSRVHVRPEILIRVLAPEL